MTLWGGQRVHEPRMRNGCRAGVAIRIYMRGPDGNMYPMKGVFQEIIPPQRLVFSSSALEDEKGNA